MLRDAQVTNRAQLKQGRCKVHLLIAREKRDGSANVDGELTWIEEDFLLKFRVTDPSHIYFKNPESEFGADWNYLLRRREGVRLYNSRSRQASSRTAAPGSFDSLFHLNPWLKLYTCCPPDNAPPAGRQWVEMIGPHPAMREVMAHSSFQFEHLPDGSIKQIRRDRDGSVGEIVFSSEQNYNVASLVQRDPQNATEQSVTYSYQKIGTATLPAECVAWSRGGGPRVTFTYKYSDWDVKSPVSPARCRSRGSARWSGSFRVRVEVSPPGRPRG